MESGRWYVVILQCEGLISKSDQNIRNIVLEQNHKKTYNELVFFSIHKVQHVMVAIFIISSYHIGG